MHLALSYSDIDGRSKRRQSLVVGHDKSLLARWERARSRVQRVLLEQLQHGERTDSRPRNNPRNKPNDTPITKYYQRTSCFVLQK